MYFELILQIVYYTTTAVKSWPVQSTCKLLPEPKARVANTCSGLAFFTPMLRLRFFIIPGPKKKYHIRVPEPGAKVVLLARVW